MARSYAQGLLLHTLTRALCKGITLVSLANASLSSASCLDDPETVPAVQGVRFLYMAVYSGSGFYDTFEDAFAAEYASAAGPVELYWINGPYPVEDALRGIGMGYTRAWNYCDSLAKFQATGNCIPTAVVIEFPYWAWVCPSDSYRLEIPLCVAVAPPDQQRFTVSLSGDGSSSGGRLADVEPGKPTGILRAKVHCKGDIVANVPVRLEVSVSANSGGHSHHDNNRPKGLLSSGFAAGTVVDGYTGTDGMPFTFLAPAPAGDHNIKATCLDRPCTQEGPETVWVGIKGLVPLSGSGSYQLVGYTASHPSNSHNLAIGVSGLVRTLANIYRSRFPTDPVLHLNDASLERGGLFDSDAHKGKPWQPPHSTHRKGTDIDIRWNPTKHPTTSIPDRNVNKFKKQVLDLGGKAVPAYVGTDNQHFHVEFGG